MVEEQEVPTETIMHLAALFIIVGIIALVILLNIPQQLCEDYLFEALNFSILGLNPAQLICSPFGVFGNI